MNAGTKPDAGTRIAGRAENRYAGTPSVPDYGFVEFINMSNLADSSWYYSYVVSPKVDPSGLFQFYEDVYRVDPTNQSEYEINMDSDTNDIGEAEILAHIIPGRGKALGATPEAGGEITNAVNLAKDFAADGLVYTDSAYDHSKQMNSYYGESKAYWEQVLKKAKLDSLGGK